MALLHQVYAAPGTADGWSTVLESLRVALHGSGTHLICHDSRSRSATVLAYAGTATGGIALCQQHWPAHGFWAQGARHALPASGSVSVGDVLVAPATCSRTTSSAEFVPHYELVRLIGGVLERGPGGASFISASRSEGQPPFDRHEVVLLEALIPHVQRALHLHRRLTALDGAAQALTNTIDMSARAVFLIDADGRVIFANRAASTLVSTRDGLTIEDGELRAVRAADTIRLRTLLACAVRTSSGEGLASGGALAIARRSHRRPFQVLVSPGSQHRTFFPAVRAAAAIVFVTDPEQVGVPDQAMLRTLFGLTLAEAKLTCLLALGCSLQEAGTRLGVRRETARSRLKTIFAKTNTHRQAELVRLVAGDAASVRSRLLEETARQR